MAWVFADGFDLYTSTTDMDDGYWDTTGNAMGSVGLVTGRFSGSRALSWNASGVSNLLVKTSGVNDAVHHLVVAFQQTATLSSQLGLYLQFLDGATGQCAIVFNKNGDIVLQSGAAGGTTLATYAGAFAANVWYAFEFEIVINNTTGSFKARKNGNTIDDFSATGLNTRVSTNNYANKLQINENASVSNQLIDDLFWKSDASSVPWLGDIRCQTQMPASDASVVFSRTPSGAYSLIPQTSTGSVIINQGKYVPFTIGNNGSIGTVTLVFTAASTANFKCSIFSDNAGAPGTTLGSATPISAPGIGTATFTFGTPVSVTAGTKYWVGAIADASSGVLGTSATLTTGVTTTVPNYAAFPASNPTVTTGANPVCFGIGVTPAVNWPFVSEAQQDALTSYVYSSTVNDADFYGIGTMPSTPSSIVAVTTRGYMQKGDVGTRTAAAQLRSVSFSPTAWNPSDEVGTVTLSNANLTASLGSSAGVRAVGSQSSGAYYFEITATTWTSNQCYLGLANAAANVGSASNTLLNVAALGGGGTMFVHGNNLGSLSGTANGSVICIAVNLTSKLVWFRVGAGGNWNNNAGYSPGGTGGLNLTPIVTGGVPLFPFISAQFGGAVCTANFGATAFTGAVPSGFTAGFLGPSSVTVASPTLTLTTSGWQWAWRTDLVDPNTSAAWTASAVNNMQIGPKIIA